MQKADAHTKPCGHPFFLYIVAYVLGKFCLFFAYALGKSCLFFAYVLGNKSIFAT